MRANPFLVDYSTDQEELDLIQEALQGHKPALEQLLKKHQPFIYNIAWKMVQNPVNAEDITQEVMIKVITNLSKFEGRSKFRTWLYRIVVNHFLQMQKSPRELLINDGFSSFAGRLDSLPDQDLTDMEKEELINEIKEVNLACMSAMLLCLTRDQRLVYILGELFNADHRIGGELLDISPGNFRVRLSRARKDLLSFMNNQCGLINKANPCRCHKKVTAMVNAKAVDSRNLLFNQKEYQKFQQFISKDVDEMLDIILEKHRVLHQEFPFKSDFDKKDYLRDVLDDPKFKGFMNLN